MDENCYAKSIEDKPVSNQFPAVKHHLAPGRLALPILLILLVLHLSEFIAAMDHLWPVALNIYALTVLVQWFHTGSNRLDAGQFARTLAISALPLLLLFPTYTTVTSLFQLEYSQVQLVVSVGLAVTYFNLGAVIFSGNKPIDGGRILPDGRRLLGEGKTIRGATGGLILSMGIGWITGIGAAAGLMIGMLTMLGDLSASLLKRRLGLARGHPVIILDQLDSIIFLLILESGFHTLGLGPWSLVAFILATFLVQVCGNYILFLLGKKQVPW